MKTELGVIGLGVMGKSLARNLAEHGYRLSLFNRHVPKTEEDVASLFIKDHSVLKNCIGFDNLELFVKSLETPRKILIMVNAGEAVDYVISALQKFIEPKDILIDGGNSYFKNTNNRIQLLEKSEIYLIGLGVSGGEKGALIGPSLMPGGNLNAYASVQSYLENIAAKNINNDPCCQFIGNGASGHFVKMVHNGIEYAEMQLIAEVYSILRFVNGNSPSEISAIFKSWCQTHLNSFLLKSTAQIIEHKKNDTALIDLILDKASHKGTGSWTTIAAAELGVPFTMSSAALNARYISALKTMRVKLSKDYTFGKNDKKSMAAEQLKNAYEISRIINHHQGFELIVKASDHYNWNVNLEHIANIWTNGCIIASELMVELSEILKKSNSVLENKTINNRIISNYADLKDTIKNSIASDIAIPCLTESLTYLNSITCANGTGNIIQAQRDYFGAHTFKLIDDPMGKDHHSNWDN